MNECRTEEKLDVQYVKHPVKEDSTGNVALVKEKTNEVCSLICSLGI